MNSFLVQMLFYFLTVYMALWPIALNLILGFCSGAECGWIVFASHRKTVQCKELMIPILKDTWNTPEFFLLLYPIGFTVASMIPFLNRRSKENSSRMSISALVVAFATFVFGLCFVYLWRHMSKTQHQGTTQPRSKQTKTEAKIASSHWCRKGWYMSNQLETTIQERCHTLDREAGLI